MLFLPQFMAASGTTVVLKQSGESFNRGAENGEFWTTEARMAVAKSIAEAFHNRKQLGVRGIVVVPGAGNIARGRGLQGQGIKYPDMFGRLFMFANAAMLTEDLRDFGVDVEPMSAHGMEYKDRHITFSAYNTQKVLDEHQDGKVVIVAGGTGEDDRTSDNAMVYYAKELLGLAPGPVRLLKGTTPDGVYESDPAKPGPKPRRYKTISAEEMLANYDERFQDIVDKPGLQLMVDLPMAIHVFAESKHSLTQVLAHETTDPAETTIGTMVVGQECEAVFADD